MCFHYHRRRICPHGKKKHQWELRGLWVSPNPWTRGLVGLYHFTSMAMMAQIDPGLQKEPRKIKIPYIYSNNEKFKSKWAWSRSSQVKQIKQRLYHDCTTIVPEIKQSSRDCTTLPGLTVSLRNRGQKTIQPSLLHWLLLWFWTLYRNLVSSS